MTPGLTEAQAAASFMNDHGAVFGGPLQSGHPETELVWTMPSMDGDFVAFKYRQKIRGKDVEGSDIRVKVHRQPIARVDYAAARLSGEPTVGNEAPMLTAEVAGAVAQALSGLSGLVIEGTPEVVALCGDGVRPDAWCWRIHTHQGDASTGARRTFFVDTAMPRILYVRNHFAGYQPPTTGVVAAPGTPLPDPNCKYCPYMGPGTSLTYNPMPDVAMHLSTNPISWGFTDWHGVYSFSWDPQQVLLVPTDVTLNYRGPAQLHQWRHYDDSGNPANWFECLHAGGYIPVPSGMNFILGNEEIPEPNREEFGVAQSDIMVTTGRARLFFQTYISTSAPRLSNQVILKPNKVNVLPLFDCALTSDSFTFFTIEIARRSGTRWNCSCHAVVAHEYGHIALAMLGLPNTDYPGFDEGYADTFSFLLNDDRVFGRQLKLDGSNERNDPTIVNLQYPITIGSSACEAHQAGQLLSGPWIRIVDHFKDHYGTTDGLERARELFGRWTLITKGGEPLPSCQSAYAKTLVEVLSVSKSDQKAFVCDAFLAHGITLDSCP